MLVSRLRSVLGGRERIAHQDGGYRLHYDWLDAAELASLIDEVDRPPRGRQRGRRGGRRPGRALPGPRRPARPPPRPASGPRMRQAELTRLASRGPPGRRPAAAGGRRLGDRGRRRDRGPGPGPVRRIRAAPAAAGLRRGRPAGRGARRLRRGQGSAWPTSWAPTRPRRPSRCTPRSCAASGPRPARARPPRPAATHAGGQPRIVGRDDELGLPRHDRRPGPRRPHRGRDRRGRGRHRQDDPAALLGRPAGRGRATRSCSPRAARWTGRCRWTPCSPRWPPCSAAGARKPPRPSWTRMPPILAPLLGTAAAARPAQPAHRPGRQHARPGRALRRADPGAPPPHRAGPAPAGPWSRHRRRAPGRPRPGRPAPLRGRQDLGLPWSPLSAPARAARCPPPPASS